MYIYVCSLRYARDTVVCSSHLPYHQEPHLQ
jgi:hypothetical protein